MESGRSNEESVEREPKVDKQVKEAPVNKMQKEPDPPKRRGTISDGGKVG